MSGEQNRKRGRDGAYSNPNVESAKQDTLRKVGQVLAANYGLTLPQATIPEVIPNGETDEQRRQRRADIALAQALARGQASTANHEGVQPGVGRGTNPGQTRRIPGSSPFNHTKDSSQ